MSAKEKPTTSRAKSFAVTDCTFANAVKIGKHQLNYINSEAYDIRLIGTIISVRKKDWKEDHKTVYTTVNNLIYWR